MVGTFNSHALLIGKFSAAFSTKTPQLCQLTQTRALTRVFFPLPLLKNPASPFPISRVVLGLPGGKQEAGAGQGPDEERNARGAHAPPAVLGFLRHPSTFFWVWGKAQAAAWAAGFSLSGRLLICRKLRSHFTTCHPLSPRGSRGSATAGSAGGRSRSAAAWMMLSNRPIPQRKRLLHRRPMGLCEPTAWPGCPAYPRERREPHRGGRASPGALNVLSAAARGRSQLGPVQLWETRRKLCDTQPKLPFLLSPSVTSYGGATVRPGFLLSLCSPRFNAGLLSGAPRRGQTLRWSSQDIQI